MAVASGESAMHGPGLWTWRVAWRGTSKWSKVLSLTNGKVSKKVKSLRNAIIGRWYLSYMCLHTESGRLSEVPQTSS